MKIITFHKKWYSQLCRTCPALVRNLYTIAAIINDRSFIKQVREEIKRLEKNPKFELVEIETINRCNNDCDFCPVNRKIDPRPYRVMDEQLFTEIIQQLKDIHYSGWLGLYSNNEPLLDKRIEKFAAIAANALPNAKIHLYTNAILLNLDKFKSLMNYLDYLVIDNYTETNEINKHIKELIDYIQKHPEYSKRVTLHIIDKRAIRDTRAGMAKNRNRCYFLKSPCVLPFKQVIIRPDGKLSLCCQDSLGKFTMGDLTKETILEIWNNQKYKTIRELISNGRDKISFCSQCDFFDILTQPVWTDEYKK